MRIEKVNLKTLPAKLFRLCVRILPYSITSSRSKCLTPVPLAPTLPLFKSWSSLSRWKEKNLHKAKGQSMSTQLHNYELGTSSAPGRSQKWRNALLWTILSRLTRLLRDFCHRKKDMNFFFSFPFFMSLPQASLLLWWWLLLNTGLWQHDREKKQREPPLTYSQSLYSLVKLSFLDTCLIVTAVYYR